MELTRVILGPIVTEKAERMKAAARHTYTLKVAPKATKVDVLRAIEKQYDVEVASVRVTKVQSKHRQLPQGNMMEKRSAFKKAFITLKPKSKALDLSALQSH